MNINQLLIITLILYIFFDIYENKEGFSGEITLETCLQRILENGCINTEERTNINNDCNAFTLPMPYGETNIRCDNQELYNWLICQQMIRNGACECNFGRNQIKTLCGNDPLNLECPVRLSAPSNEVFEKIKELEEITLTCDNIEQREQKVNEITQEIEGMLKDIEKEATPCFGNYLSIGLTFIISIILGFFVVLALKKK